MCEITQKKCFKCGEVKSLSDFYKHKVMSDGHLNKCKDCTKADVRKHRMENPSVQAYDRSRGSRGSAEGTRKYRSEYPKKYTAHMVLGNALRAGKICKPINCEVCNVVANLHGHHDDYNEPLNVRWLCPLCHSRWHAKYGEAKNST